jgi:alkylhydroperoxidase family enzyme
MSWIREEDIGLPNIIKVMSILPKEMQAVRDLNSALMFGGSTLTRVQEESIAATVSVINNCHF